ncbi:MAG: hypothetical protein KKB37_06220 [Alphaproteobacteria bacterium]|nr:hypothetical protein [Alphaproteobacteria bacterium]
MTDQSYLFAGVAGYVGRPDEVGEVGVFRRKVAGGDWQHVLAGLETYCVHVHAGQSNVVLAGTQDGIWRSTDHGATFTRADFPDAKKQVWSFLVDSRDGNRILAGGSPIDVYRSDDCGATWRKLPNPGMPEHCKVVFDARVMRMVQNPVRPDEVFAALEVNGAMRSLDFGETWIDCSEHLIALSEQEHLKSKIVSDTYSEGMLDGHAITISPEKLDQVVLALRMGLFRSIDKGATWTDMQIGRFSPTTYARDVKVSAQDPKTIYAAMSVAAASHDGGVYRSQDAGETWSRFDRVQVHGTIMSIGLNPHDARQLYIGARYNGEIFGTIDGGETWAAMPLPSPVKDIYSLIAG